MARKREAIAADLESVGIALEANAERRVKLYERRRQLFVEAGALDPPMTKVAMAAHARVSEAAVSQALQPPDAPRPKRARSSARAD